MPKAKKVSSGKKVSAKKVSAKAKADDKILDTAEDVSKEPAPAPVAEEKKDEGKYHILIETNDTEYETDTDDIKGYILSLGLTYLKTKTVITVSVGKKSVEKILMSAFARRLFSNDMTALIFEKNILQALGQ